MQASLNVKLSWGKIMHRNNAYSFTQTFVKNIHKSQRYNNEY